NVVAAVAVEVADAGDLPVRIRHGAHEALRTNRGAVHEVHVVLPRGGVAPQDVCLAVAVEVADTDDLPVEVRDGAHKAFSGKNGLTVHRVKIVLPARRIAPQDIGAAVAVQ